MIKDEEFREDEDPHDEAWDLIWDAQRNPRPLESVPELEWVRAAILISEVISDMSPVLVEHLVDSIADLVKAKSSADTEAVSRARLAIVQLLVPTEVAIASRPIELDPQSQASVEPEPKERVA